MLNWIITKVKTLIGAIWHYFKNAEIKRISHWKGSSGNKLSILWQNDLDVVLAAIKYKYCNFHSLLPKWRANKRIKMALLNVDPKNLQYLPELQDDEEIVCLTLRKNAFSLKFASKRLKNKASVVRFATDNNYWSLKFASKELKDNSAFMLEMVIKHGVLGFQFVSDRLKHDWAFLLEALMRERRMDSIIYHIPDKLLNEDFILIASLISREPYKWILLRRTYRLDEIIPGLFEKITNIKMNTEDALLQLGAKKEKELEKKGIYHPAKIYNAGSLYGLLSTSKFIDKNTKTITPLPYIPFEIAMLISQFSAFYVKKPSPVSCVNRSSLNAANTALETAKMKGYFNFSSHSQ